MNQEPSIRPESEPQDAVQPAAGQSTAVTNQAQAAVPHGGIVPEGSNKSDFGRSFTRLASIGLCFSMLLASLLIGGVGSGLLLADKQPSIPPILGHLHLLMVHFPLAFLVVGAFMAFVSVFKRSWQSLVGVMVFIGAASGILALLSGLLAAIAYGYDFSRVWVHLVLGCATVCFAWLWWLLLRLRSNGSGTLGFAVLGLLLVSATGFSGGSFSHGDLYDYLMGKMGFAPASAAAPAASSVAASVGSSAAGGDNSVANSAQQQQADALTLKQKADALWKQVEPMMQSACVNCHNADRAKAGVDVSSREAIVKSVDPALFELHEPQQSLLVTIIESGDMPPSSYADKAPDKQQIEIIKQWLQAESALLLAK